jgi:hypothetical protein
MAPVHTEHDGFRVRVLWLDIAGSREAWTLLASARRGAKVRCEHLRFVARLECDPLEFVHGAIGNTKLGVHSQHEWLAVFRRDGVVHERAAAYQVVSKQAVSPGIIFLHVHAFRVATNLTSRGGPKRLYSV